MPWFGYQRIVVLLALTSHIDGSCLYDLLKSSSSSNNTSDNLISDKYCEYSGMKYAVHSSWSIPYPDCLTCQCGPDELECCGYGIEAGIIEPSENCQLAAGTCAVIFVRKDDPSKSCVENHSAKPMRIFRKKKIQIRRKSLTIISYKRS